MGEVIPFARRETSSGRPRTDIAEHASPPAGRPATAPPQGRPPNAGERPKGREPLWREVTGAVLRDERRRQRRTLAQVAQRAGMSVQYLSELERGRKEASSEMLAAACGALGLTLAEFAGRCVRAIGPISTRPAGPVLLAA